MPGAARSGRIFGRDRLPAGSGPRAGRWKQKRDHVIDEVRWQFRTRKRKKPKQDFYEPEVYEEMVAAAQRLDDTTAELAVLITGEPGFRRSEALTGHESITTTEGYMHLSPSARSTARDRLNNRQTLLGTRVDIGANIGAAAAE